MSRKMFLCAALTVLITVQASNTLADVTSVSAQGFVSEQTLLVKGQPLDVYNSFSRDIARWWDPQHTWSGKAENLSMSTAAGGCFCEKMPNGGEVEHQRVIFANPGFTLRLDGGLGPLQELSARGVLTINLLPAEQGQTQLHFRYVVGGYGPAGLDAIAAPVDQVLMGQMQRFQRFLMTGIPGVEGQ